MAYVLEGGIHRKITPFLCRMCNGELKKSPVLLSVVRTCPSDELLHVIIVKTTP